MVFGETGPKKVNDKILAREVVLEKAPDGKELIKITIKAKVPGGQESSSATVLVGLLSRIDWSDRFHRPIRWIDPRADPKPSN